MKVWDYLNSTKLSNSKKSILSIFSHFIQKFAHFCSIVKVEIRPLLLVSGNNASKLASQSLPYFFCTLLGLSENTSEIYFFHIGPGSPDLACEKLVFDPKFGSKIPLPVKIPGF